MYSSSCISGSAWARSVLGWFGAFFAAVALALDSAGRAAAKGALQHHRLDPDASFLPGLRRVLFLLFGRDRVRWPARRKRQADALVRGMVAPKRGDEGPTSRCGPAGLTDLEKQIFHLGSLLSRGRRTPATASTS